MPSNVARFEALMYLSVAIAIVLFATQWASLASRASASGVLRIVVLTFALMLLVRVGLIWLTARKRQSWARWALLILVLLGLPQFLRILGPLLNEHPLVWAARVSQLALDTVAFVFIFTGDSREWFNPTSDPMANISTGTPI
jgi:hypothetical protein